MRLLLKKGANGLLSKLYIQLDVLLLDDSSISRFRYDHVEGVGRSKQSETRIVYSKKITAQLGF